MVLWQGLHDAVNPSWLGVIDAIQSRHVGWDVLDDMLGVQCRVRRNDKLNRYIHGACILRKQGPIHSRLQISGEISQKSLLTAGW
jgi:hypothetical protein